MKKATGIQIPYEIKPRRAGDIATCYSDASKAKRELGWEAEYGILEMCRDSWNWQKKRIQTAIRSKLSKFIKMSVLSKTGIFC